MAYSSNLKTQPPTAQTGGESFIDDELDSWMKRARDAYSFSTSYVDSNYRKSWDDSLRAFNNQHPSDSKYSQPAYDKRSKLFRPKIRSVIRKNEAAAAAAYFSNMDVVNVKASDDAIPEQVASAEVMKELLQYRLTKSIPWYQIVIGGIQDAQTVGVVCAHIHWEYEDGESESVDENDSDMEEEYPDQGKLPSGAGSVENKSMSVGMSQAEEPIPRIDKPTIDLIPIENLRIDPSASWIDPVNTSPYLIHLIPMYVMDIKSRMKSGEWITRGDGVIRASSKGYSDSTRMAREKGREDPTSSDGQSISDYEVIWVQRHIHRKDGKEWEFYMLGDVAFLTYPRPLKDVVFHGKRPYVIGNAILETHRLYPSSVCQLGKELQSEANEVSNQRIDNVKFVLNKKWFVKRGVDADLSGLVRNVPGGVVMMQDPQGDVREVTWPDVTASAFEEQNRIDNDLNELLGNFSPASLMSDKALNAPARNMAILGQSTGTLTEYLIRTFNETFIQPVLRQLVLLEQEYETDMTLVALAAKKARVFQRFGINQVTDQLLEQELTLNVNVGMGATDPQLKLQKFLVAMNSYTTMLRNPLPGINMQEVGKEIFGHLGYSDGSRFFTVSDPQMAVMQQKLQQAMQLINEMKMKLKEKGTVHMTKLQGVRETNQAKIVQENIKQAHEDRRNLATHVKSIMSEANQHGHERVLAAIRGSVNG